MGALDKELIKISPVQKIALCSPHTAMQSTVQWCICKEKQKIYLREQMLLLSLNDLKYVFAYICQMLDD